MMKLLGIPMALLTSIIMARYMSTEEFGAYSFVYALIPLIALPISGGLQQLLTKEVATYYLEEKWQLLRGIVSAATIWVIILTLIVFSTYAIFAFIIPLIPRNEKWSLLSVAILIVPFYAFNALRSGVIKGLRRPVLAELPVTTLQPIILLSAVAILALSRTLTPENALYSQLFSWAIVFIIANIILVRIVPSECYKAKAEYELHTWKSGLLPFILLSFFSTFNAHIGIVIVGFLSSDEQVAAFKVAERVSQLVSLSLVVINLIISPYIVKSFKSGDIQRLQKLSKYSARLALVIALPLGVVFIFSGKFLLKLIFGGDYATLSYTPLIILVVAQVFNVFFGSVGYILSMTGYAKDSYKGQLVALIISVVLSVLLVPRYGAVGAAYAVAVSICVWNISLGYLVYKRVNIRPTAC